MRAKLAANQIERAVQRCSHQAVVASLWLGLQADTQTLPLWRGKERIKEKDGEKGTVRHSESKYYTVSTVQWEQLSRDRGAL